MLEREGFCNIIHKSMAMIRTPKMISYGAKFHALVTPIDSNRVYSLRTHFSRCFSSNLHSQKLYVEDMPCLWVAIEQT